MAQCLCSAMGGLSLQAAIPTRSSEPLYIMCSFTSEHAGACLATSQGTFAAARVTHALLVLATERPCHCCAGFAVGTPLRVSGVPTAQRRPAILPIE